MDPYVDLGRGLVRRCQEGPSVDGLQGARGADAIRKLERFVGTHHPRILVYAVPRSLCGGGFTYVCGEVLVWLFARPGQLEHFRPLWGHVGEGLLVLRCGAWWGRAQVLFWGELLQQTAAAKV